MIGIAALACIVRSANAEPPAPAGGAEHVARFALVQPEPSEAIDACGGATAVKAAVERRLDRPVFTGEATADSTLAVSVLRIDGEPRWQAQIVERDRSGVEVGHRELVIDADDCERGIDTLAVVLAIMIGPPRKVPGAPPAAPGPVTAADVPPVAAPTRSPEPIRPPLAPPAGPRWRLAPAAAMVAGSGILPGISWGIEAGVIVLPSRSGFSFVARAQLWPARSTGTVPEGELDRLSGTVLVCHLLARADVAAFTMCAGLDAGRLHTTAPPGLEGPKSVSRFLLDVPFEGRVGFVLASWGDVRLEPNLAAQLAVVLSRDRFTYLNRSNQEITLHRAAVVGAQAAIGLAVHFGP